MRTRPQVPPGLAALRGGGRDGGSGRRTGPGALPVQQVEETTARLLAGNSYDLILTHGPHGEYTQHRRHTECCQGVAELWGRAVSIQPVVDVRLPRRRRRTASGSRRCRSADLLPEDIWVEKRRLITESYGFRPDSWEAQTTPREEGFWCFDSAQEAAKRAAPWEHQS